MSDLIYVCKDPLAIGESSFYYQLNDDTESVHHAFMYEKEAGSDHYTLLGYINIDGSVGGCNTEPRVFLKSLDDPKIIVISDTREVAQGYTHVVAQVTKNSEEYFGLEHSLYPLYPHESLSSVEALALFSYLIWGRAHLSISPLEYNYQVVANPHELPFSVLAGKQVDEDFKAGLLSVVKKVSLMQQRLEAPNAPYSKGAPKAFDVFGPDESGLFKLKPKDGSYPSLALKVLQTELNTALIANELVDTLEDSEFKASQLAFVLAEHAVFRRVAKRAYVPVSKEYAHTLLDDKSLSPQKQTEIENWIHSDEFKARKLLGSHFAYKAFACPITEYAATLCLKEGSLALEYSLPPIELMPHLSVDPNNPGTICETPKKLCEEMYEDFAYGFLILNASLGFIAIPQIKQVYVNVYEDPRRFELENSQSEAPLSFDEKRYLISLALDKETMFNLPYLSDGNIAQRLKSQSASSYIRTVSRLCEGSERVKPFIRLEELHEAYSNLALPQEFAYLDSLVQYELSADEFESLASLDDFSTQIWERLSGDSIEDERAFRRLKHFEAKHSSKLSKFLYSKDVNFRSFNSLLDIALYHEFYDFPEHMKLIPHALSDYLYVLSTAASNADQHEQAWNALKMNLQLAPAESSVYLEAAWLSYRLQDYATMKQYLDEAQKFCSTDESISRLYCYYGLLALEKRQLVKSAICMLKSIDWLESPIALEALDDISKVTQKHNAGVNFDNFEMLQTQYGIPNFPLEENFNVSYGLLEALINSRRLSDAQVLLLDMIELYQNDTSLSYLFLSLPDFKTIE